MPASPWPVKGVVVVRRYTVDANTFRIILIIKNHPHAVGIQIHGNSHFRHLHTADGGYVQTTSGGIRVCGIKSRHKRQEVNDVIEEGACDQHFQCQLSVLPDHSVGQVFHLLFPDPDAYGNSHHDLDFFIHLFF